jgi:hypothetical protein
MSRLLRYFHEFDLRLGSARDCTKPNNGESLPKPRISSPGETQQLPPFNSQRHRAQNADGDEFTLFLFRTVISQEIFSQQAYRRVSCLYAEGVFRFSFPDIVKRTILSYNAYLLCFTP